MYDVGEQIVVFQPVTRVDAFIVDRQGAGPDTPLILSRGMCPELPRKHVQDLLADPPALCERCEREVVGVHFPESCKGILS